MTWIADLEREPWRFDWFNVLRRLERGHPDLPRIGASATRREDFALLGQNPWLVFPASNVEQVARLDPARYRVISRFLGMTGPQGALPLAVTDEARIWVEGHDDSFPRFLDIFNHRYLQLFYRAWADSRPIAQAERPVARQQVRRPLAGVAPTPAPKVVGEDRFHAYLGAMIGLGTPTYHGLDTVPDAQKLAHAGLAGPAAKSAVRLEALFLGVLGLKAEVEEFVGVRLPVEVEDRTRLGRANAALGSDVMLGSTFFSVADKIRIRVSTESLADYERVLPVGDFAEPIADLVYFYLGETLEWELEPALPAREVTPMRLGRSGRVGWTSWLAPRVDPADTGERADARFNLAERVRARRAREAEDTLGGRGV